MNVENFLATLPYMLKGMLGIFVVTLVIIITIYILNKATSSIGKKDK
jgi:hypothetical protein